MDCIGDGRGDALLGKILYRADEVVTTGKSLWDAVVDEDILFVRENAKVFLMEASLHACIQAFIALKLLKICS